MKCFVDGPFGVNVSKLSDLKVSVKWIWMISKYGGFHPNNPFSFIEVILIFIDLHKIHRKNICIGFKRFNDWKNEWNNLFDVFEKILLSWDSSISVNAWDQIVWAFLILKSHCKRAACSWTPQSWSLCIQIGFNHTRRKWQEA